MMKAMNDNYSGEAKVEDVVLKLAEVADVVRDDEVVVEAMFEYLRWTAGKHYVDLENMKGLTEGLMGRIKYEQEG